METMAATSTCPLTPSLRDGQKQMQSFLQAVQRRKGVPAPVSQHTLLLLPPGFCPSVSIAEPRLLLLPLMHLYSRFRV